MVYTNYLWLFYPHYKSHKKSDGQIVDLPIQDGDFP